MSSKLKKKFSSAINVCCHLSYSSMTQGLTKVSGFLCSIKLPCFRYLLCFALKKYFNCFSKKQWFYSEINTLPCQLSAGQLSAVV